MAIRLCRRDGSAIPHSPGVSCSPSCTSRRSPVSFLRWRCCVRPAWWVVGTMQRIGSAIGIAVIGTVLFGTLRVVGGPDGVALAFGHSATLAMGVSAVLSVAAFGLGFALPRAVDPSRLDDV